MQFHETRHLVYEQKSLDLGMNKRHFLNPLVCPSICRMVHALFYLKIIPIMRRLTDFCLHVFAKSSDRCCSPFWQLLFYTYVFPPRSVLVICQRVALNLVRNQYSRHDYIVRVFALSILPSESVVLPHPHLQCARTYGNVYRIVCGFVLLVLACNSQIVSAFFDSVSDCLCISLHHRYVPSVPLSELHYCDRALSPTGGGRPYLFPNAAVESSISQGANWLTPGHVFRYVDHTDEIGCLAYPLEDSFVYASLPLSSVIPYVSKQMVQKIARIHGVPLSLHWHLSKDDLIELFKGHSCINCNLYTSVLEAQLSPSERKKRSAAKTFANFTKDEKADRNKRKNEKRNKTKACAESITLPPESTFPPPPLSKELAETIIRSWCKETKPSSLEEAGCAVCGELVPMSHLSRLKSIKTMLGILATRGVTRVERKSVSQPISEFKGPVLDYRCDKICDDCRKSIRKGKVPRLALANNLWIGEVPNVLSDLNYIEKLLVARIRHNRCFVKVASSGQRKMVAHVIAFESPIPKVYHALPPPVEDMDDVLAILFTGPLKPTAQDLSRIPLLVRRNRVAKALEWLKLNHVDYKDLDISYENLNRYPEDTPPVSIEYRCETSNKVVEGTSAFDNEVDDGVATGECPFIVHGLTGEQLDTKTVDMQKALALQHWSNGGKALAIGRSPHAESIYDNPGLYPQLFPWLFPYGHGGIGSTSLSDKKHKRHLLMYHDKRFQQDPNFPFVAFSHEQIKASTTGGFLLAETKKFDDMARRLLMVDQAVLLSIADRMSKGEIVKPSTQEEIACFQVIRDLDHIGGKVSGSVTSKKYMRNEIWSLIAHEGAPLWYITLSPADVKNPIALYYADRDVVFKPGIRAPEERYRLIANNPVACARFFHFMVQQFIKHVLGVDTNHPGLYGETSAYYGTVEQQGRLTLHIHLLLWIKGGLTPDEIRDRIIDPTSDFQQRIVEYIENAHQGEFMTGTQADVLSSVSKAMQTDTYLDPTETLPEPPPAPCAIVPASNCKDCERCRKLKVWREEFAHKVDDVISKSNIHTCSTNINKNGTRNKARSYKGCLDNKWGKCRSRFPRKTYAKTEVDPVTGALNIKKKESWINNFTAVVSYLFRCNTDVTSLRSGTAIKGTLIYVSDYITKMTLKTHVAFDSIRSVFQKNSEMLAGRESQQVKARKLMTKMVNTMSAKLELGSPMICLYLLDNPDHYTSHRFVPFYWLSFVQEVRKAWEDDLAGECRQKVAILKRNGRVIGISNVHDYIYRPKGLEDVSLYDWISTYQRVKLPAKAKIRARTGSSDDEAVAETDRNKMQDDLTVTDDDDDGLGGPSISDFDSDHDSRNVAGTLRFTAQHPLFATHGLKRLSSPLVPNFVGQTLPRRDQGDREFYCITMLTLFKPWRTGSTLRQRDATWDETFATHTFTDRQEQIMRNFNIRYECLDQKDDYLSELRKEATVVPDWMNDDLVAERNQSEVLDKLDELSSEDLLTGDIDIDDQQSQKFRQQLKSMSVTKHMMTRLGWTACKPGILPILAPHKPVSGICAGSEWKEVVASKRQDILENRLQTYQVGRLDDAPSLGSEQLFQGVKIVDKNYLEKKCEILEWKNELDLVAKAFHLNADQERAFQIVANHSCRPTSERLKMYIGGMGGTGKSQVLKALMKFFKSKNESHRIIIVAPTGSAAALLGGSTYHYMFGINDFTSKKSGNVQLAEVKQRLRGVDYIFMDEVSMLSCKDMYKISERLARVMNNTEEPFGGLNIIFAGDFAQLPPAIGQEHASLYSRTVGLNPRSLRDQESAIGKALWHQITTVVILRQNMRQKTQTPDDARLRDALSNMRYKACTPDDIAFLRSRISSEIEGRPSVNEKQFHNVSVITALNLPKDVINDLGSQRFAAETGQELIDFYSEDVVSSTDIQSRKTSKKNRHNYSDRKQVKMPSLSQTLQQTIWDLPPSNNTKNIPGKLSLCRGLPVIIRLNSATELCMTKGQEAIVYDWQSSRGSRGQCMLDTLFVKLVNPPQTVQLDNLPENVVPLTRTVTNTQCVLPNDTTLNIARSQVEVLPNFAMTDYTSQGKTRLVNVVDLSNARNHQSYYTALSRSASAAGTVILQGFDTYKITGGASGALRQEFRELEMLDDVTTLRYNGKLPDSVVGDCRNDLISTFRLLKGNKYIPSKVHPAIRWKDSDPFHLSEGTDIAWKIIDCSKEQNSTTVASLAELKMVSPFVLVKGNHETVSATPSVLGKRKLDTEFDPRPGTSKAVSKKIRRSSSLSNTKEHCAPTVEHSESGQCTRTSNPASPRGLQWSNNSCAFDAVMSILYNVWLDNVTERTVQFKNINNEYLGQIADGFSQTTAQGTASAYTLEEVREFLRRRLHRANPTVFAWGRYTGIQNIMDYLLATSQPVTSSSLRCPNNHPLDRAGSLTSSCQITILRQCPDIQAFINDQSIECASRCCVCRSHLIRQHVFEDTPAVIVFDMSLHQTSLLENVVITTVNGISTTYKLRGVMYYSDNHFTSRFISETGSVWYHDGIFTGRQMVPEGNLSEISNILGTCQSQIASCAVYVTPSHI